MLSEARINANYVTLTKRMEKYGIYSEEMLNDIGEKIRFGTYNKSEDDGGCYDGALVDVTLNTLCRFGYQINERLFGKENAEDYLHPVMYSNIASILRVLILINLPKAEMYTKETEQWKVKKGMLYKFDDQLNSTMKMGARAIYLCQKYGIKLTEEEFETLMYVDDDDDKVPQKFRTPLYATVKSARLFTAMELRKKWESDHKLCTSNEVEE